mgnify:CR=1 FL=1
MSRSLPRSARVSGSTSHRPAAANEPAPSGLLTLAARPTPARLPLFPHSRESLLAALRKQVFGRVQGPIRRRAYALWRSGLSIALIAALARDRSREPRSLRQALKTKQRQKKNKTSSLPVVKSHARKTPHRESTSAGWRRIGGPMLSRRAREEEPGPRQSHEPAPPRARRVLVVRESVSKVERGGAREKTNPARAGG